ncbi:6712_t:CDS:2, partial [Gigaspora rosea]
MTESPITSISPAIDIINNNSTTTQNRRFSNFNNVHNCLAKHLHLSPYVVAELLRTLISFISLVISAFFCTFAIQWSDFRWTNYNKDMDPLEDLAFKTPQIDYVFLADIAMLTLLVGSLVINMVIAASNIARIIILRRICWLLSFLLIFRGISIGVTVLPSPKQCTPLNTVGSFLNMLKTSCYLIIGSVKACTDNMYSGHSTFITLRIKRTEDIIGDKELYQRIVYVPNMFNTSLFGVVRWMDGLDIRFRHEAEKIRDKNSGQSSPNNDLANEMIQIEVSHSPNE